MLCIALNILSLLRLKSSRGFASTISSSTRAGHGGGSRGLCPKAEEGGAVSRLSLLRFRQSAAMVSLRLEAVGLVTTGDLETAAPGQKRSLRRTRRHPVLAACPQRAAREPHRAPGLPLSAFHVPRRQLL